MTAAGPESPRLVESYFTLNPDTVSDVGLLTVPVAGEALSVGENAAFASVIREAIDLTRVDDPQALVLEALYQGDGIPRNLVDSVRSTTTDPVVGLPLRQALYSLHSTFPGVISLDLDLLGQAMEHNMRRGVVLLTGDGLRAENVPGGSLQPLVEGRSAEDFLSDKERRLAHALGSGIYAYNMELVWQENAGVLEPQLLSRRIHLAVGRIAASGSIEHAGTILSPGHPAYSYS